MKRLIHIGDSATVAVIGKAPKHRPYIRIADRHGNMLAFIESNRAVEALYRRWKAAQTK